MAVVAPYSPPLPLPTMRDDHVMDTRTPSPRPRGDPVQESTPADAAGDGDGDGDYKPDLSAEVALLSTKLVNAINFQTNLDDTLQHTRHELEHSRQKSDALEAENKRITDMIAEGILVKRSEMDERLGRLRAELAAEKAAREAAEKARKETENELENLTSALFEEANTMVAAARKDAEVVERKNLQLKEQLHDTEMMMVSQTEQLRELKDALEKLQAAEGARLSRDPSVPSTPIATASMDFETLQQPQISPLHAAAGVAAPEQLPDHPLHFAQLLAPVLRDDTAAFAEFQDLLQMARRLGVHSRTNSNQTTASTTPSTHPSTATAAGHAATSSPGMPGSFTFSANSSPSSSISTTFGGGTSSSASLPALKDSRFYKRVLTEDLEPTLRLDIAPGLSFLSRRTVLSALLTGTLTVEPFPQNKHYYACALCGEARRTDPWIRKHHFRTSEDDAAPKPLCAYCLGRLRAACDFVGFLRMVREGLWRCEKVEERKGAWEESVRLRERMFWARVGGGVVPAWQVAMQEKEKEREREREREKEREKVVENAGSAKSAGSERVSLESIPEGAQASAGAGVDSVAVAAPGPVNGPEEISSSPTMTTREDEAKFTTPPPSRHEAQVSEEQEAEDENAVTPTSEVAAASTASFEDAKEIVSPVVEERGAVEESEDVGPAVAKDGEEVTALHEQPTTETTPEPVAATAPTPPAAGEESPSPSAEDATTALSPPSTITTTTPTTTTTPSTDAPKSRKLPSSRPASTASNSTASSTSRLPTSRPTSSIRTPSASRPTSALRTPSSSRPVSSSLSAAASSPASSSTTASASGARSSSVLARVRAMEKEGPGSGPK